MYAIRSYYEVGSSTMPQKRNPWNSEHVKSLWKAFAPRVMTFFMDQISEHQRDLTNSASQRFVADYLAGFGLAVSRMKSVVSGLQADREGMAKNLANAGGKVKGGVLAEPAYILLAESGISDGHEVIRTITLDAEKNGITFFEALVITSYSIHYTKLYDLAMPLYAGSVIIGGVQFASQTLGVNYEIALLFFVAVVALYVVMGGMKGVMYTDAFQGALMFIGMTFSYNFV